MIKLSELFRKAKVVNTEFEPIVILIDKPVRIIWEDTRGKK